MKQYIPLRITHRTYRALRKGANTIFWETVQTKKNRDYVSELNRLAEEVKAKGGPTK